MDWVSAAPAITKQVICLQLWAGNKIPLPRRKEIILGEKINKIRISLAVELIHLTEPGYGALTGVV